MKRNCENNFNRIGNWETLFLEIFFDKIEKEIKIWKAVILQSENEKNCRNRNTVSKYNFYEINEGQNEVFGLADT